VGGYYHLHLVAFIKNGRKLFFGEIRFQKLLSVPDAAPSVDKNDLGVNVDEEIVEHGGVPTVLTKGLLIRRTLSEDIGF